MVFVREEFFNQCYLQFMLMVYCGSWSAVVLDVIVGVILWELFVMQMTWHC